MHTNPLADVYMLAAKRNVTVTQEEHHQEALVSLRLPQKVVATLHPVPIHSARTRD